ncbi:hypothetical protein [Streptomyces sp. CB01881]|uniref:hypothetical protein n=1 Tax=Streptomyces sp. CB01881 TaxID=2078691 RepID=UPI000CDBE2B0|nr:hypothetical protein [Streptomyces sp. CB01881]AUY53821.1 hypothetical protein C2142_38975 [Streptomyces sp. CB01881]TYC68829.1 hypothetical protein EH183_38970 [Streptomyces sp. CB01881]
MALAQTISAARAADPAEVRDAGEAVKAEADAEIEASSSGRSGGSCGSCGSWPRTTPGWSAGSPAARTLIDGGEFALTYTHRMRVQEQPASFVVLVRAVWLCDLPETERLRPVRHLPGPILPAGLAGGGVGNR